MITTIFLTISLVIMVLCLITIAICFQIEKSIKKFKEDEADNLEAHSKLFSEIVFLHKNAFHIRSDLDLIKKYIESSQNVIDSQNSYPVDKPRKLKPKTEEQKRHLAEKKRQWWAVKKAASNLKAADEVRLRVDPTA
jgi:hypothetical protein